MKEFDFLRMQRCLNAAAEATLRIGAEMNGLVAEYILPHVLSLDELESTDRPVWIEPEEWDAPGAWAIPTKEKAYLDGCIVMTTAEGKIDADREMYGISWRAWSDEPDLGRRTSWPWDKYGRPAHERD